MNELETLKYPIGRYRFPANVSDEIVSNWISDIEEFPQQLETLVKPLDKEQLEWKYRPDGWCIRQLVHHCADSHINSLIRFKLAITEDTPTINPYFEDRWAETKDNDAPVETSLMILKGLHSRWVTLLKSFTKEDLDKKYFHPEHKKEFTLVDAIAQYAWHCRHHIHHVELAIKAKGRF